MPTSQSILLHILRTRSSTYATSDFDNNIPAFHPAISAGVFLRSTGLPAFDLSCAVIEHIPISTFNYIIPFDFVVVMELVGRPWKGWWHHMIGADDLWVVFRLESEGDARYIPHAIWYLTGHWRHALVFQFHFAMTIVIVAWAVIWNRRVLVPESKEHDARLSQLTWAFWLGSCTTGLDRVIWSDSHEDSRRVWQVQFDRSDESILRSSPT